METVLGTPTVTVLPSTGRVGEKVVVVTGQVLSGGTEIFKYEDLVYTSVLFIDWAVLETVLGTPTVTVLPSTGKVGE